MQLPVKVDRHGKKDADGVESNHRREGFLIVYAVDLGKVMNYQSSFVAMDGPVRIVFEGGHPMIADNISICRSIDEVPGATTNKSRILFIHSGFPVRK